MSHSGTKAPPFDLSKYEATYKELHANPGLTTQESFAAARILENLERLKKLLPTGNEMDIHDKIGGFGTAAVLRNGPGPTVLLRADMDGLPVEEKSGLSYASKHTEFDPFSKVETKTMHACGHDMHMSCLLAAAEWLITTMDKWSGTLLMVFQPAEERAIGARAMIKDGLYDKVPVPDIVLGQHLWALRTGQVSLHPGIWMAASDSFNVTLYGRGGHGSMPHNCIDPVVLAAHVIVRLQDIVSREVHPAEPAVLTIGSVQAGETENVIPGFAVIKVNIRSHSEEGRKRILASFHRIIKAECNASGCEKAPLIEQTVETPMTINDTKTAQKLMATFEKTFGDDFLPNEPVSSASEDFSILATSINKPYCFWFWGGIDSEKWDKAKREDRIVEDIPVNHSPFFVPVIEPTLSTGVRTMYVAALTFLGKK